MCTDEEKKEISELEKDRCRYCPKFVPIWEGALAGDCSFHNKQKTWFSTCKQRSMGEVK